LELTPLPERAFLECALRLVVLVPPAKCKYQIILVVNIQNQAAVSNGRAERITSTLPHGRSLSSELLGRLARCQPALEIDSPCCERTELLALGTRCDVRCVGDFWIVIGRGAATDKGRAQAACAFAGELAKPCILRLPLCEGLGGYPGSVQLAGQNAELVRVSFDASVEGATTGCLDSIAPGDDRTRGGISGQRGLTVLQVAGSLGTVEDGGGTGECTGSGPEHGDTRPAPPTYAG